MKIKLPVAALVGIVLGIVASRFLCVGSALSLIPWAIAGLLIGLWCLTYKQAVAAGALYGFLLAFSFMLAGYQGIDPVMSKLGFFAIFGVIGAVCGLGLGVSGAFMRRKFFRGAK